MTAPSLDNQPEAQTWAARIRQSATARNLARLVSAAALAQLVAIAVSPVNTRVFGPANYGLAALFAGMVSVLSPVMCLRYDLAVMLPGDEGESARVWRLCLRLIGLFTGAVLMGIPIVLWTDWPETAARMGSWLWLLPVAAAITALNGLAGVWVNRKKAYDLMSVHRILMAVATALLPLLAAAALGVSALWLILGAITGQAAALCYYLRSLHRTGRLPPRADGSAAGVMRRYRQFPLFNLPMNLLDNFTSALPVIVFAAAFTAETAGHFNLSRNVLSLPAGLIGGAVASVFFERASRLSDRPEALQRLVRRFAGALALVSVAPLAVVTLAGPALFGFVFGIEWREAGDFARALAWSSAANLIVSPISTLPSVLGLQHQNLLFSVGQCLLRIAAISAGVWLASATIAVIAFASVEVAGALVYMIWVRHFCARRLRIAREVRH